MLFMLRAILFLIASVASFMHIDAEEHRTIPNELSQTWPWELVSMDFPRGTFNSNDLQVQSTAALVETTDPKTRERSRKNVPVDDTPNAWTRHAQLEQTTQDGEDIDRVWFIASVLGKESINRGRKSHQKAPKALNVVIKPGSATDDSMKVAENESFYLIDNGVYEFRLRKSLTFAEAQPLHKVKHWIGGMRTNGSDAWDGKAFFEGTAAVTSVDVAILNQGPVFWDFKVTYNFKNETSDKTVSALPLMLGKQSFRYDVTNNILPSKEIPVEQNRYEVKIRFVVGDPWIDIAERYRLPRDKKVANWGIHQYHIHWGPTRDHLPFEYIDIPQDEHMAIDTAFWVRWYLYDVFGGNSHQQYVDAKPRKDQKGRPFALLRPRWNQGGGGAQDFFLTSGGKPPPSTQNILKILNNHISNMRKGLKKETDKGKKAQRNKEIKDLIAQLKAIDPTDEEALRSFGDSIGKTIPRNDAYSPNLPAMGIIATYPSKWVGPYEGTISAYVRENARSARFPLIDGRGGIGPDGPTDNKYYGSRAYAICVGERSRFRNLNSIVRRHTDWTLTALINKYILRWERKPEALSPKIRLSRERLLELRKLHENNDSGIEGSIINAAMKDHLALVNQADNLRETIAQEKTIEREIRNLKNLAKKAKEQAVRKKLDSQLNTKSQDLKIAKEASAKARKKLKSIDKKLNSEENKLLGIIRGASIRGSKQPDAQMYLSRRYQDDSVNPTNFGNRRLVNGAFQGELYNADRHYGGAAVAAVGYIYSDLDAWPGWQNGWSPGNPNFHTDKYIAAVFAGASMPDHPHANEWLSFGKTNFLEDTKKVMLAPHGVGYECPGYAGFALYLQYKSAVAFLNSGLQNPVVENPMFKKNLIWQRKLLTPYDKRIARRHAAPLGDTHRWDAGAADKGLFAGFAKFYKDADPEFAQELMATHQLMIDSGVNKSPKGVYGQLIFKNPSIPAADYNELDWSSEFFYGFGSIMRNNFGSDQESFITLKAGPTRGHYHNDELSYHFYANGSPISLDYNCSYTPRADHAGLHNSATFGKVGKVKHNKTGKMVEAMEQTGATARVGAFVGSPKADVIVAERTANGLNMSPLDPYNAEFQRRYPYRKTESLTHRRLLKLVKHPQGSKMPDYLVVRDEFKNKAEAQQINIHLLARDAHVDGNTISLNGQLDKDMVVHFAQADGLKVETKGWGYYDQYMLSPGEDYEYRPGETTADWEKRMEELKQRDGRIPKVGWKPRWKKGVSEEEVQHWYNLKKASKAKSMMPPPGWEESWLYGEYQVWLRCHTAPGSQALWVLFPYDKGSEKPSFTTLNGGKGIRVTHAGISEDIFLSSEHGAQVIRDGETVELIAAGELPELGKIKGKAEIAINRPQSKKIISR